MHRPASAAIIATLSLMIPLLGCGRPKTPRQEEGAASPTPSRAEAAVTGTEWPAFRGPNADGIAPDTGINKDWSRKPPRTLWKVSLGDGGYAGPSVADGKLFVIDHKEDQDVVRALNLRSGKEAWMFAYSDTAKANYGFARATPVFSEGKLYTLSRLGLLHCLDAGTGKKVWSRDIRGEFNGKRPSWDYAMSPLVDGEKLIVCPGGQTGVAALDKNSGRTLWTGGKSGPPGYATPVAARLGGHEQYVVFAGTSLFAVDVSSGKTLWHIPWQTKLDVNAAMPLVIEDFVYVTSGYGTGSGMFKISGGGAKLVWKSPAIQAHFNTPVYYDGLIYGIGDPGNLVCLNPQDGATMWKQKGFEKGGVVGVDGVIIAVGGKDGDVVMVRADHTSYQELGRTKPLGGQSWTAPIIANGKLIIRNTQAIACLELM